ncbi:MAG: DUF1015 domain-containing protein [Oscillospiraceae bacterium]|nr:DUF1015 domain-containing protein [Oscillospiraceae bacterium]
MKNSKTAFSAADILLPEKAYMTQSWPVVACDQYTGEPAYWAETDRIAGEQPSALRLILPEVYLEDADVTERIAKIQQTMREYLAAGIFAEYQNAMVYLERIQSDGKLRAGLIGKIDLEQYDYSKGSVSPVRATEATVPERIPPRVRIRRGAALELPHIMILLDDTQKTVIEPLEAKKADMEQLYDLPLMQGGGSAKGWLIPAEEQARILDALTALGTASGEEHPLVYAMGDGNHSLATAKAYYEEWKAANPGADTENAPQRYALVELVNLHSPALEFEAIHRILNRVDTAKLMADMTAALDLRTDSDAAQQFTVILNGTKTVYGIGAPTSNLTVGSVQMFLDAWLKENGGKIDYIHGAEVVENLAKEADSLGILLPDMQKAELFPTVIKDGALPRKTFSMGHAADKRYYMECRRISE